MFEDWLLTDTSALRSFFESAEKPAFAAVETSKLQNLRDEFGRSSDEYLTYADEVRQLLDEVINDQPNLNFAILTYERASNEGRSEFIRQSQSPFPTRPTPQEPIGAISSCFRTEDVCKNSTNSCSGRGNCVLASKAGRSCFVCACGVTTKGEGSKAQTTRWAGQSCERKDISSYVIVEPPLWLPSNLVFALAPSLSSLEQSLF